jgi:hypothetical protein
MLKPSGTAPEPKADADQAFNLGVWWMVIFPADVNFIAPRKQTDNLCKQLLRSTPPPAPPISFKISFPIVQQAGRRILI